MKTAFGKEYIMEIKLEDFWKLQASTWSSFQRRADHEFKFSVAIWTAAAALIALRLQGSIELTLSMCCAILLVIGFVGLHSWYEYGMTKSNNTDLEKYYSLEDTIRAKMNHTWPNDLQDRIDSLKKRGWAKKNWSHIGHVGITAILAIIAAVLLTTPQSPPNKETGKPSLSLTSGHEIETPGKHMQELKTLPATPPVPLEKHGDEVTPPQGTKE